VREGFAFQRVVDPASRRVLQVAVQLILTDHAHTPAYPNGVTIPSEYRSNMPVLEGHQQLLMKSPRQEPWFAGLDQMMCEIAMAESTSGVQRVSDLVPDVAALALDDDRVVGYACGECTPRNMVAIMSEPGTINPARIVILPQSSSFKFPSVCILWTAASYRRAGIARTLIEGIARAFNARPQDLAYEVPFSSAGLRLVQGIVGLKFMASAPRMVMTNAPLDQEHWLTGCHSRAVMAEGNAEAMQRAQKKLADLGYSPELPDQVKWSDMGTPGGSPH
jgi:GNAT superfamily N-acetyltransferase